MFCNKCGNEIADNLKFCNKCGNEIKKESINNVEKITKESDNLAGFWVRAGAFIIDFVISYLGAWLLLGVFIGVMNPGSDFFDKISDEAAGLLSFGVVIIYHIALLSKWGTTIGKKLFGLKVVDLETNNKITINKAVIRSLSYILSSIVFGAGFLVIAFDKKKRQGWHDIIAKTRVVEEKDKKLTLAIIISIFAILGLMYISSDSFLSNDQESILPTVANIYCPLSSEKMNLESNGYGGSGTIIDPEGLVLTNSHVIPQESEYLDINKEGCFVIINNQKTQEPEIYLANPIVIPELSDTYDIAYLKIYDVYIDEKYKKWGEYPKIFPSFKDGSACADETVKLGEQVRVYGYPISTGGASLTVTDGIVSSLPGEGLILTSAKIDQGNSGGVAVDSNGCMIGIPSAVSKGEYENMGVIISTNLISEFKEKYDNYLLKTFENDSPIKKNALDLSAFDNKNESNSEIVPSENIDKNNNLLENQVINKGINGYKIRIYNNYEKDQPLVATTRIMSPDKKIFRIEKTITIPAQSNMEVGIYLDNNNDKNFYYPKNTKFTIPGLWVDLQNEIYGLTDEAMAGN